MKIEQITVTDENMLELMRSEDAYVIRRMYGGEYRMCKIGECEVKDLVSGTATVIRITNE